MQVAQPNECEKYKLHVEEIDKITSLLLGLAARLARAENAFALCTDQSEKVRKRYGILLYKFAQKSFTKKAMKCRHSKRCLKAKNLIFLLFWYNGMFSFLKVV